MGIVKKYEELTKKEAETNPEKAYKMIKLGLFLEKQIVKLSSKEVPKAYTKLSLIAINSILRALKEPENSAWINIFTPVEILQCFDINPLSIECMACFMSGFECEDFVNEYAENIGIAETLCSYHKGFIGTVESGILPKPKFAFTTSTCCDGNVNTIRYLAKKHSLDSYILDIPYEYSLESEKYVVTQLKEMIDMLEEKSGKKFDEDKLKEILKRENESKKFFKEYLKYQRTKYYPSSLTLHMYMLFAAHVGIGTKEIYDFYKLLAEDIKKYPESEGVKMFWVHLLPYYQETMKEYFNFNPKYQIQSYDINFDYMEELDIEHPLEALAKKLILNIYNGPYERKIKAIEKAVDTLQSEAVIHFCHWGCKQSSGGVMQLKQTMKEKSIPMLILDGDCMDRRNCHDGQLKTRLEAFLEILKNKEASR
ncbi:2-hydroxyacyl-CoA dehydratase subunit D [Clostridium scatologenes]|uniref:2-hydroxyglutaryl-CoA dehydratase D-component n=1 Tax=Clostridium scatologenes TaxID=1548 RepID=A0A0E3M7A8_CLOSL|nr:2-hydroxyacyl-CoA dehydratase family protein [Clostridium scatologenes]AKA67553.1 2-hydroxyglutaryl-CoA dehydratase D-component [Clostridium scatologenes]